MNKLTYSTQAESKFIYDDVYTRLNLVVRLPRTSSNGPSECLDDTNNPKWVKKLMRNIITTAYERMCKSIEIGPSQPTYNVEGVAQKSSDA